MKSGRFACALLLIALLALAGCGYYFPHVYDAST